MHTQSQYAGSRLPDKKNTTQFCSIVTHLILTTDVHLELKKKQ